MDKRYPLKAIHISGGNFFDDIRIDIAASHTLIDEYINNSKKYQLDGILKNYVRLVSFLIAHILGINEFLVVNGLRKKWYSQFNYYWREILNGRPLWSVMEFFPLLHNYRKKQQHTKPLKWKDENQHIKNWQNESELYSTLHYALKIALFPAIKPLFSIKLPKGGHILEYGCGAAPFYGAYKDFFSYKKCSWVLADIPNFPFHYAKCIYGNDEGVEFKTINKNFSKVLQADNKFDVIILTTVLEHVDSPVDLMNHLLDQLNIGGTLIFDYIKSFGFGLDHPNALKLREEALQLILKRTKIIKGDLSDIEKNVELCFVKRVI